MARVETVRIVSKVSESGYVVINKSDLTSKHKIFEEKKESPKVKKVEVKNEKNK